MEEEWKERLKEWGLEPCMEIFTGILPLRGEPGLRVRTGHWLPSRILLLFVFVMTLVASPITIYNFWRHKLTILVGPIISMFVTGQGLVMLVSLLYRGEKFHDMINKLHELRSFRQAARLRNTMSLGIAMHLVVLTSLIFVIVLISVPVYYFKRVPFFEYNYPTDTSKRTGYKISFAVVIIALSTSFQLAIVISSFLMACLLEALCQLRLLNYNLSIVFVTESPISLNDGRLRPAQTQFFSLDRRQERVRYLQEQPKSTLKGVKRTKTSKLKRRRENQEASARLRLCISHHVMITRFVRSLEDAFQPYLIQQYMCTIFPVTLIILFVTYSHVFDLRLVINLVIVCTVTVHQLAFCWLSKKLTDEGDAVRLAVYSMDWFEATESFKRSLRIMLTRSNIPLVVKIAGIIPLDMETFYGMMQAIYTYYMWLVTTMHMHIN